MNPTTRRKHFRAVYGTDPNFMTPDFVRYDYGVADNGAEFIAEITQGSGFRGEILYGLTVITKDGRGESWRRTKGISGCHDSVFTCSALFGAVIGGKIQEDA